MPGDGEQSCGISSSLLAFSRGLGGTGNAGGQSRGVSQSRGKGQLWDGGKSREIAAIQCLSCWETLFPCWRKLVARQSKFGRGGKVEEGEEEEEEAEVPLL